MNIVEELLKVSLLGSAWVLYLLLTLSVLSLGLSAERAWYFSRNAKGGGEALRQGLLTRLKAGDTAGAVALLQASPSEEGRTVAAAAAFLDGGPAAFTAALDAELAHSRKRLEAGMTFLGTIGNNAPFIGLFGTVIGVIAAFEELGSAAARAGAMGNVMSGIAEALVATGVGLFVALPAVIAYNVFQKRIGDIEQDTIALGRLLVAALESDAQKTSRSPRAAIGA